jgi:hypothetical protein
LRAVEQLKHNLPIYASNDWNRRPAFGLFQKVAQLFCSAVTPKSRGIGTSSQYRRSSSALRISFRASASTSTPILFILLASFILSNDADR